MFYQVSELVSAMTFIREPDDEMLPTKQPVPKPRFRPAVIAIIALNRLVRWSAYSCLLCTVHYGLPLGPVHTAVCIGDVAPDNVSPFAGGKYVLVYYFS